MFQFLRRPASPPADAPAVPPGVRVYAIGDVHGRRDLLDALLTAIDADDAARRPADTAVVLLGDLVDRGPDSAGVLASVRRLAAARAGTRLILGNHEEVFARALAGDAEALRAFCRMGGRETAISYGIDPADYDRYDYPELAVALAAAVPEADRALLAAAEDVVEIGDYAFVHAGIDPAAPLAEQKPRHLRWIREPFLNHRGALERVVVHGHTVSDEPEFRRHRIGVDTGAWRTGVLTALGLEGTERWTLRT